MTLEPVDLDAVLAALDAPHVVRFTYMGWTVRHPFGCRPGLFTCPVTTACAMFDSAPVASGDYEVTLDESGDLVIGARVTDAEVETIDWPATIRQLAAEARQARTRDRSARRVYRAAYDDRMSADEPWRPRHSKVVDDFDHVESLVARIRELHEDPGASHRRDA